MQKIGSHLKSVREEKGYSIEEVSKATKISSPVIRALEDGRLDNVDPVYLKGFLKLYCRFLGLSWEEFLKEHPLPFFFKETPHPYVVARKAKEEKASAATAAAKLENRAVNSGVKSPFFLPGLRVLSAFLSKNKKAALVVLMLVSGLLSAALLYKGVIFAKKKISRISVSIPRFIKAAPKAELKKPSKQPPKAKEPAAAKTTLPAKKAAVVAPAQGLIPSAKEAKAKNSVTLVARAQEDNFIKVKVDGRLVYQGLLHKGKAESWTAKEKIELSVANAGSIVLEVDGKIISPSLGRRGEPLKNILINSDGLKIL